MASVTVFVDDVVRGDFPPVCARTGLPATEIATIKVPVARPSSAVWLLVLLGPVGWLILLILLGGGHQQEFLTVQLPYSQGSKDKFLTRRKDRNVAIVAGIVLAALSLALLPVAASPVWFLPAAIVFAVAVWRHWQMNHDDVAITLDGSRRWVTLTRVADEFADAVRSRGQRSLED